MIFHHGDEIVYLENGTANGEESRDSSHRNWLGCGVAMREHQRASARDVSPRMSDDVVFPHDPELRTPSSPDLIRLHNRYRCETSLKQQRPAA